MMPKKSRIGHQYCEKSDFNWLSEDGTTYFEYEILNDCLHLFDGVT